MIDSDPEQLFNLSCIGLALNVGPCYRSNTEFLNHFLKN